MKKLLLSLVLCSLFVGNTLAQSNPTAPTNNKPRTINAVLLDKAIDGLDIPVYLPTAENVTIQYYWYPTKMAFGEEVRSGNTPEKTETGVYTNGRLHMYYKETCVYKIHWSYDGGITLIVKYRTTGEEIRSYTLSSFNMKWVDRKDLKSSGSGLSSGASIYISNVVLQNEIKYDDLLHLDGYYMSGDALYKKTSRKVLRKSSGQLAKKWVDESETDLVTRFTPDGMYLNSTSRFNSYNPTRCELYYLQ